MFAIWHLILSGESEHQPRQTHENRFATLLHSNYIIIIIHTIEQQHKKFDKEYLISFVVIPSFETLWNSPCKKKNNNKNKNLMHV